MENVRKFEFALPHIVEQDKIAASLNALQLKQNQLLKKKSLLEQYKKGMMQKIFNREVRIKDEDGKEFGEWEVTTLSTLANIRKGTQLNSDKLTDNGIYPCINGGIYASGYTDKFNSENSITISEGGNSCGFVNFFKGKFWSGGHCYTLQIINDRADSLFLYQLLKHNEFTIMSLRVGSGLPNIQKGAISNLSLFYPKELKEQTKIANFLSAIDDKINHVEGQIEKMEEWKKGLLGEMFV